MQALSPFLCCHLPPPIPYPPPPLATPASPPAASVAFLSNGDSFSSLGAYLYSLAPDLLLDTLLLLHLLGEGRRLATHLRLLRLCRQQAPPIS